MKKLCKLLLSGSLLIVSMLSVFAMKNETSMKIMEKTFTSLVDGSGKKLNLSYSDKEYVFIYYFSVLSPECKMFTPELVKFYKENMNKASLEIIFVCINTSEEDMKKQITSIYIPCPFVDFKEIAQSGILKFAGKDLPSLVLLDKRGNILADCYEGKQYMGPTKVFESFKEIMSNAGFD